VRIDFDAHHRIQLRELKAKFLVHVGDQLVSSDSSTFDHLLVELACVPSELDGDWHQPTSGAIHLLILVALSFTSGSLFLDLR
jgi:hypothetical protein